MPIQKIPERCHKTDLVLVYEFIFIRRDILSAYDISTRPEAHLIGTSRYPTR